FVGYQAEGTLGRRIKEGAKEVKIFGEDIRVNAQIHALEGFSAHADQAEIMQWLRNFKKRPKKVFLVHGEQEALATLSDLIQHEFNMATIVPQIGDHFLLKGTDEIISIEEAEEKIQKEQQLFEEEAEQLRELMTFVLEQIEQKSKEELPIEEVVKLRNKIMELRKEGLELSLLLKTNKSKNNRDKK
ncbi:MAG: MBL fold metallo-hydrolase RNA specificity domain-containing protein, partial [Candidatus Caldatribacteriota bacterium]